MDRPSVKLTNYIIHNTIHSKVLFMLSYIALIAHWTDNVVVIVNFLMDTLLSDRYTACMIFKKKMIK